MIDPLNLFFIALANRFSDSRNMLNAKVTLLLCLMLMTSLGCVNTEVIIQEPEDESTLNENVGGPTLEEDTLAPQNDSPTREDSELEVTEADTSSSADMDIEQNDQSSEGDEELPVIIDEPEGEGNGGGLEDILNELLGGEESTDEGGLEDDNNDDTNAGNPLEEILDALFGGGGENDFEGAPIDSDDPGQDTAQDGPQDFLEDLVADFLGDSEAEVCGESRPCSEGFGCDESEIGSDIIPGGFDLPLGLCRELCDPLECGLSELFGDTCCTNPEHRCEASLDLEELDAVGYCRPPTEQGFDF